MSTELPLLFSTRELALSSLYTAYAIAPAAVQARLHLDEAALHGLLDPLLLAAFVERAALCLEALLRVEEQLRAALPGAIVSLPSATPPLSALPAYVWEASRASGAPATGAYPGSNAHTDAMPGTPAPTATTASDILAGLAAMLHGKPAPEAPPVHVAATATDASLNVADSRSPSRL